MVTFLFPWILQRLCTTFPAPGHVWVGGRSCSCRLGCCIMNLVRFELFGMLKSLTHPFLMSLAPGIPQRSEFFSLSKLITSSSIYSVKAEVHEFYPFPCQIFLFLKKWMSKKINCLEKRKQADPSIVTLQKHLFILGTKMEASDSFPPCNGYINFCY